MSLLPETFTGIQYRLANNWRAYLDDGSISKRPLKYLEIGVLCGANFFSVANTYASHPDSELHCIDPWEPYGENYDHDSNYENFLKNLEQSEHASRIHVHKGFSGLEIPKFSNEYFDIIYIDGNHDSRHTMEDAVLAFQKLKVGGFLIIDDCTFPSVRVALDGFLSSYSEHLTILGEHDTQCFLKKIST